MIKNTRWRSGLGLLLVFGVCLTGRGDVVLVAEDAEWRYLNGIAEASLPDRTAWRQPNFVDTAWLKGRGPFFFEDASGFTGNTDLTDMRGSYTCIFLRRAFDVANPAAHAALTLSLQADDGCVVWLNGAVVARVNMAEGEPLCTDTSLAPLGEPNVATEVITDAGALLLPGKNVLAIQAFNASLADSTDFLIAATLTSSLDIVPPAVASVVPAAGAAVRDLTAIEVVFDENVTGVDAADLRVNGVPAQGVQAYSPRDYGFQILEPAVGPVTVTWSANPGITDLAGNSYAGGSWSYTLDKTVPLGDVLISEFLTDNDHGIRDDHGNRSDWIELWNRGAEPISLAGWFLTDDDDDLTRWRIPNVTLNANTYLIVWATGLDATNPAMALHANFKLDDAGEYLALVDPNTNVVSEFAPAYPRQRSDISYGRDRANPAIVGYFATPTPGSANSNSGSGFAPTPVFSLPGGVYTNGTLSVTLSTPSGTLRYTTNGTVPTTSSPVYSGPIAFSSSLVIQARVFATGLLPSPIIVQTYTLLAASTAAFNSNLPLLIVNTQGRAIPQDSRVPAFVTAIEPYRGRASLLTAPQVQCNAQIEVRGQSSAGFPKLGYNLELDDPEGYDLDTSLLGLPEESDWVLYNPYSDKPFLQNFLAYELHEKMGHYAPRRLFVELFVDTSRGKLEYPADYAGIYILVEKIKVSNNRVDLARLTPQHNALPEVSGGYIVKKDKDSPGDVGFGTQGGGGFSSQYLKIHEPKPREVTSSQLTWIRNYLNQFEKALYAGNWLTATGTNHYSYYIDVDSFVDNHWIVEFAKQIDGYRLSNYMHKDRGGKLGMDPIWDWNLSFGNADYLNGQYTTGWYYTLIDENAHIWLRRLITGTTSPSTTSGDPDFNQKIADRWSVLRTNVFNATNVLARIDELAALLDEAQVRDFARWPRLGTYVWPNPPLYSTPTTYSGIIANMKAWVQGRYTWIDTQFLKPPLFSRADSGVSAGFQLTMSAPAGTVYCTLDGSDPRAPGGALSSQARQYTGSIAIQSNSRVVARARSGNRWSGPTAATYTVAPVPLIVSELMYAPAASPGADPGDTARFEFIELKNIGSQTLDLKGFRFVAGIEFSFATGQVTSLPPGARVVIAHDTAAFTARYGVLPCLAGAFDGSLDNQGERLRLLGAMQETVADFTYAPNWFPPTDGLGFALVAADEGQSGDESSLPSGWRTGSTFGGTPGQPEPLPPHIPPVVVNEALTHAGPGQQTAIELHNPSAEEVDIGGWYLSDDRLTPKFRIPPDTRMLPGAYLVFTEHDFNPTPGVPPSFNLGRDGDDVYLFSTDASGQLTGYQHGFEFGPAAQGVTFGRHRTSTGEDRFSAQKSPTLGFVNDALGIGPVVISEIMYRPPDVVTNNAAWDNTEFEYVELCNLEAAELPLFNPDAPTNTWRLESAIEYRFPTNLSLAARERVLVVPFDPAVGTAAAAFRARYSLSPSVRLFGPFSGKLANDTDILRLVQPVLAGNVPTNRVVLDVLVDEVRYWDAPPWPAGADGMGYSLQRSAENDFGNDPAHWVAARPTPGAALAVAAPPVITLDPVSQRADPGGRVTFTVAVSGSGPFFYRWQHNGSLISAATAATLELNNVQPAQAGEYRALVRNTSRAVESAAARLTVGWPPVISAQPAPVSVQPGAAATFSIIAAGNAPLDYQWRLDGVAIPGARSAVLNIAAVTADDEGTYEVVVSDDTGQTISAPATLEVRGDPLIVHPPFGATVSPGTYFAFSVAVTNTAPTPFVYHWFKDGGSVAQHAHADFVDFLELPDVQPGDAGTYTVRISNPACASPGLASPPASLEVVPPKDTDGDKLPDDYETQSGLDPHNPVDAAADADGDGAGNLDEYLAGTDPQDADSVLRIDPLDLGNGVTLRFRGLASRSYAVLWRDRAPGAPWQVLAGIPATAATGTAVRTVEIVDPAGIMPGLRFYRIVSPGR